MRGLAASVERAEAGAHVLTIVAERGAFAVEIDARGWDVDDNYFHLAPGRARRVRLTPGAGRASVIGVSALNATDSVRVVMP